MANRLMIIFDSTKDFEKQKQTRANNDQHGRENRKIFISSYMLVLLV